MKKLIDKIIQTITAIVVSCIVVYGMVYVQQICCSTIVNACIPMPTMITVVYAGGNSWTSSQSYNCNNKLPSNICSKNFLANSGPKNTCCETDSCDSYNQDTYFCLPFIQDFYPLQKNVSSYDAGDSTQTTFEPYSLPASLKTVPIYLMTKSIIC